MAKKKGVKPGTKRGPYKKSDREPLTAEITVYTTKSKKKKLQERYKSKPLQNEFRKLIDKLIK